MDWHSKKLEGITTALRSETFSKVVANVVLVILVVTQVWFALQLRQVYACQTKYNVAAAEDRKQFDKMWNTLLDGRVTSAERRQAAFDYQRYRLDHPLSTPEEYCE